MYCTSAARSRSFTRALAVVISLSVTAHTARPATLLLAFTVRVPPPVVPVVPSAVQPSEVSPMEPVTLPHVTPLLPAVLLPICPAVNFRERDTSTPLPFWLSLAAASISATCWPSVCRSSSHMKLLTVAVLVPAPPSFVRARFVILP